MKDVRRWLTDADPVAGEPGLSNADAQMIRHAVLAAARARDVSFMRQPLVVAAALQGFSVVLLLGDMQGGTTADNVPPAARKALADMKDFLPYKSYRLLDAAWIIGSNGTHATTRLRGSESHDYELNLAAEV